MGGSQACSSWQGLASDGAQFCVGTTPDAAPLVVRAVQLSEGKGDDLVRIAGPADEFGYLVDDPPLAGLAIDAELAM